MPKLWNAAHEHAKHADAPNFTEAREQAKREARATWNLNVKRARLSREVNGATLDAEHALDRLSVAREALAEAEAEQRAAKRREFAARSKLAQLDH